MCAASEKKRGNIDWFVANRDKLLTDQRLRNKFVVIHDLEVKSSFDTFDAALRAALATLPADEFAIQQVVEENATINFLRAAC